jgi:hypothetical protein
MTQKTIDLTAAFTNNSQNVRVDTSGYDYAILQIEVPSAQINFNTSVDAGALTGITDGNALMATNFQPADALNTATQTYSVSASTSGLFRFNVVGRFLQFVAAGGTTVGKLLLSLQRSSS